MNQRARKYLNSQPCLTTAGKYCTPTVRLRTKTTWQQHRWVSDIAPHELFGDTLRSDPPDFSPLNLAEWSRRKGCCQM
jgi:hypothetical protein